MKNLHLLVTIIALSAANVGAIETVVGPGTIPVGDGQVVEMKFTDYTPFQLKIGMTCHDTNGGVNGVSVFKGPLDVLVPSGYVITYRLMNAENIDSVILPRDDISQSVTINVPSGKRIAILASWDTGRRLTMEKDGNQSAPFAAIPDFDYAGPCSITFSSQPNNFNYWTFAIVDNVLVTSLSSGIGLNPGSGRVAVEQSSDMVNWKTVGFISIPTESAERSFFRLSANN